MPESTTVVTSLRYSDADAAIRWLEQAFGFIQHAIYRDPKSGHIVHAQLVLRRGNSSAVGMVMLGSTQNQPDVPNYSVQPREVGGVTSSAYLIVESCDPVYASAKAVGAEIVMDLRTMEYGGQSFTVRDPEGHIWSVGEYDPFALSTS